MRMLLPSPLSLSLSLSLSRKLSPQFCPSKGLKARRKEIAINLKVSRTDVSEILNSLGIECCLRLPSLNKWLSSLFDRLNRVILLRLISSYSTHFIRETKNVLWTLLGTFLEGLYYMRDEFIENMCRADFSLLL